MSFLNDRLGLDRAGMLHGLQLAFAAWLAFTIAAYFHVQNAYWAAMPIWVVAQPTRGLLLERAVFRIIGTLLGVGVGFLLLHLTPQPYLHLVGFALWTALCAALMHVLRGVHAYGALMAGITAAIIILPSVLDPHHTLDRAVARVECTLIGVLVVTLVTGFFTPASSRQAFYKQVRTLAGDAVAFAALAVRGLPLENREKKILAEISEVEASASLVSAGSVAGYQRLRHVETLAGASLEVMAAGLSIRDAQHTTQTNPELADHLDTLAAHLREDSANQSPGLPQDTITCPDHPRLYAALDQLRQADQVLFHEPTEADITSFGRKAVYLAPHHDWNLARRMALVCGLLAFLTACLGLASGQRAGLMTALAITIFSLILSSVPLPQQLAPKLLMGIFAGVCAAVSYRLTLQPHLTTLADLCVSILPFILLGSLARASRVTAIPALEANMCFMFLSQAGMPAAPPASVIMDALSIIAGAVLVAGGFMMLPRRPLTQARTAASLICRDLSRLLQSPYPDWRPQTTRHILRLINHLSQAGDTSQMVWTHEGLLAPLNLGDAIQNLRRISADPQADSQSRQEALSALTWLKDFSTDPANLSNRLRQQAQMSSYKPLAIALMETSAALQNGIGLFQFGTRQETESRNG